MSMNKTPYWGFIIIWKAKMNYAHNTDVSWAIMFEPHLLFDRFWEVQCHSQEFSKFLGGFRYLWITMALSSNFCWINPQGSHLVSSFFLISIKWISHTTTTSYWKSREDLCRISTEEIQTAKNQCYTVLFLKHPWPFPWLSCSLPLGYLVFDFFPPPLPLLYGILSNTQICNQLSSLLLQNLCS